MKLVCVFVISIVTFVTSHPYGYGVKGGSAAVAKADANAAAITFPETGPAPLSIPSGGSYSGSYSKSSSSSFAASSANSHSNSFTYSGSGTIPSGAGYGANGIPGPTKCTSGICPTGANGPAGVVGQGYSGASAGAAAGAVVYPGAYGPVNTGCSGSDCSNKQNCDGGNCGDNTDSKKCASGDCGSSQTTTAAGSNDIYVPSYNSKPSTPSAKPYDVTTAYTSSRTTCAYGNCGPTSVPSSSNKHSQSDAYPSSTTFVNKPSPDLIAPKEEPCTTAGCLPSGNEYDIKKPSSYNVPSNTVYSQSKPCSSGNCGNNKELNSSLPPTSTGQSDCTSGNCVNSVKITGNPSKPPSDYHGDYPNLVPLAPSGNPPKPSISQTYPTRVPSYPTTVSANLGSSAGNYAPIKPVGPVTPVGPVSIPPKEKIPYSGGFGGPPGILNPNEFTAPSKLPGADHKPTAPTESSYKPISLAPSNPISNSQPTRTCTSGNCGPNFITSYNPVAPTNQPCALGNCAQPSLVPAQHDQNSSPSYSHYQPTMPTETYKPVVTTSFSSGSYQPANSPGLIESNPCSSGNCGSQTKPTASSTSHFPSSPICTSGNCGPISTPVVPQFSQGGSYKPKNPVSYNPSGPIEPLKPVGSICSAGKCDSQPALHKPQYVPYNPVPEGSYNPPTSTGTYSPTACSSGNCASKPSQPQYNQNGSYNPSELTGSFSHTGSSVQTSCPSGNCGSQTNPPFPTGSYTFTVPSDSYGPKPSLQGSSQKPNIPTTSPTGPYNPGSCPSGNCGSLPYQPQTPSYSPSGPSVSYNPSCSYGNCQQTHVSQTRPHNKPIAPSGSASFVSTACTSGNCGANSPNPAPVFPNFGAPAGILKPNEFIAPPGSASGSYSPVSSGIPSYNSKPILPTTQTSNSASTPKESYGSPCTSGICGVKPQPSGYGQAGSSSHAAAAANAIAYTGGFGGPPGLLKPYDGGKLLSGFGASTSQISSNLGTASGSNTHSLYGKSLNGNVQAAGGNAQAAAVAGAAAGSYGGAKSQSSEDKPSGGCNGGCNGGAGHDNASAKAVAGAVSSASAGAYGGSFASSSASAHASAGAATKGGYGKR